ncbi:MAG: DUF1223 domain-containing protein [Halopseudomonas sp.]
MCRTRNIILCLLLLVSPVTVAQSFQQQGSPPQLVELYTSQGCSSCPPADRRLATLLNHPQLWRRFVPMAFHVDYWDYLGWQDRFAQPEYTQRQRALNRSGQFRSVYTPAWLIDGREWRGFFSRQDWPDPVAIDGGVLTAELTGQQLQVSYQSTKAIDQPTVHVALLGFDRTTEIAAGENRGSTSEHQFVVVDKQQRGGDIWLFSLPLSAANGRAALAVWITEAGRSQPRQVLGGWID